MILGKKNLVNHKTCPAPIDIVQYIIALNDEHGSASRFGSFSGAVYDTAWLSMVEKDHAGLKTPLFPECFKYLLDSQQEDGAWGATASQVDGILNSLAGLLALATRQRSNQMDSLDSKSLTARIERTHSAIQNLLQDWDVSRSVHVGFEILIPSLLRQLKSFNIQFDFPGYSILMHLYNEKLQKFSSKLVYSTKSTTLLHSLEAFIGLVNFDKVGHHCNEVSGILGSPAATAAYLINATAWDDRAERYLKMVVAASGETGAVPSAYPTCLFEISWTLSTLLAPGLLPRQLTEGEKQRLGGLFETNMNRQGGVVGFAPGVLEDADDTARALMTLQCLGKPTDPSQMIEKFQTDSYFRTYRLEGSPSFSANCHVLLALLGCSEPTSYQDQIEKALKYLLVAEESGPISDKWNLASQYSRMLFMQTLLSVLDKYHAGCIPSLPATVIYDRIPGSVCRLLGQTLSTQESNGSWAGAPEVTAYSILTISYCLSIPWPASLRDQLKASILRGRQYIQNEYRPTDKLDYLWVEKVSYRSALLYSTYCSAALNISNTERNWDVAIVDCFSLPYESRKQMGHLFSNLPLFQQSKLASVDLILIEAGQLAKRLRKSRDTLFTRDDLPMTADKYVEFIPIIWVACNHQNRYILPVNIVWEMVLLSLLNFQVDEYMESFVVRITESEMPKLLKLLKRECRGTNLLDAVTVDAAKEDMDLARPAKKRRLSLQEVESVHDDLAENSAVAQVFKTLSCFVQFVTRHWSVQQSPVSMQLEVSKEIYKFLDAHIIHNQDNVSLARSKNTASKDDLQHTKDERSYLDWVRSTASDDTSCPFSFLFFTSLISEPGQNCFEGARATYFSKCLCRHLATMCRQYNDYGSAKRDAEECNLNSLDFSEFQSSTSHADQSENGTDNAHSAKAVDINGTLEAIQENQEPDSRSETKAQNSTRASAKTDLMAIAEFERSCMRLALKNLAQISTPSIIAQLQVFIDVTDMFGQIYVQRDIASRVKDPQH